MKIYTKLSIIALFGLITFTSCESNTQDNSDATTEKSKTENIDEQVVSENTTVTESEPETLIPEGVAIEGDHSLDNMCLEKSLSDCYIVDYFIEMDVEYITVDFVTYELDKDSKHTDYEVYDLINDSKKLRTFVVNSQYKNCGHNKDIPLTDLIKISKDSPETVFRLEAEEGVVSELYIDTCSG